MKVLNKLVWRNFFLNKKRTIVTIIGIMLSTALITAVANMAESFRESMVEYEKIYSGDFHYAFYDVKRENLKYFENNRNIQSFGCIYDVGYAALEGSKNDDKPYLYISAMDEGGIRAAGLKLISGRLPQNDGEVVISKHIQTNGGVIYKIGDKLNLSVGERVITGEAIEAGENLDQSNPYTYEAEELITVQNIEYTIVGIIERPNMHIEQRTAPGYTIVTMLTDKNIPEDVDVYAKYTKSALKNRDKVTASIFGISEEDYSRYYKQGQFNEEINRKMNSFASNHVCNVWLLKWELMMFSDSTKTMLYSVAAVLIIIIIFTSVFCIRNSFVISLTEKMKLYGMMSSMGATKKQRKRLVHGEAFLLGIIGIPLGIVCGVLATYIVIVCTSGLMEKAANLSLVYSFSVPAVVAGAVLAAVTVYFSSGSAARKAAKVSPIVAIRGNETVKVRANELRMPAILRKIFKIEGAIAYKSLRRARVKYRTTVISIVVSVAVFVAMTTFTQLGFKASSIYYDDVLYQLRLALYSKDDYRDLMWVTQLEEVRRVSFIRSTSIEADAQAVPYNEKYINLSPGYFKNISTEAFVVLSIGEAEYASYIKKLGLSYDKTKDKGILIADYLNLDENNKRTVGMKYEYKAGDMVNAKVMKSDTGSVYDSIDIEIAMQTDMRPMGLENRNKGIGTEGIIVVSDEWMDAHEEIMYEYSDFFIQCDDPDETEKSIEERITTGRYYLENKRREYEQQQSFMILISVFLYGFIIVISLIGITNIFNTITTNMELRQREFATLKSIGMTRREFRRMVWLESIFYGIKSLLIGIPIGIVLSVCFYKAFSSGMELPYELPYSGILISILAVFLLLFATTQYSMNKINQKNIVETIQNENI